MNDENKINYSVFENIKQTKSNGDEFWNARDLQEILEYKEWRKFEGVIEKAKNSCLLSGFDVSENFIKTSTKIKVGSLERKVCDYNLTRYACYLIAQNSDNRKKVVALAQTYFAVSTRKFELIDENFNLLSEEQKRIYNRNITKVENRKLNHAALGAGVKNFDQFHNAGYRGLYNGESADDIAKRKKLRYREEILDNMGSEELGANIFRITQTEAKLKKENISNEFDANAAHFEVGKNVRNAIKANNGTMPEDLPTPRKSLKEINKSKKIV